MSFLRPARLDFHFSCIWRSVQQHLLACGMSAWSISSTTHVRHASQCLRVLSVQSLSRKYDEKIVGYITYTVSVCRRLFRPGLEAPYTTHRLSTRKPPIAWRNVPYVSTSSPERDREPTMPIRLNSPFPTCICSELAR